MGIFDLFKRTQKPSLNDITKYTNEPSDLCDGEILFMAYANKHDTDVSTFAQRYKYEYDLDYDQEIQKLLQLGYLSIDTAENSLGLYKISDLKLFLKKSGLKTSGNKNELISRIIESTSGYENYFVKRSFIITPAGRNIVQQYKIRRISALKKKIANTITFIRNRQYDSIIQIYESSPDPKKPYSIGYSKDAIRRDVDAIIEYSNMGHNSDRDLAILIVVALYKARYEEALLTLKDVGYDDVIESEIYTAESSISSLQNIATFKEVGIKKYKISSCCDSRVCEKCKKMDGKKFLVANAKLRKNLPPFCDHCRCIIQGEFQI